jgi:hypothetical protein
MTKSKNVEKKQTNKDESEEARNNLLGFFDLLLKVDMRKNPHLYKKDKSV